MTNPKELCPLCKSNMKGVNSKMCMECNKKRLSNRRKIKLDDKGNALDKKSKDKLIKVGQTTSDGKYYI